MKTSLITKLELLAQGKYPHALNGGEFERLAMGESMKASNASRRCREMVKAGVLERIGGKSVSYRWIPPELRTTEPKESPRLPTKFWRSVNQRTPAVVAEINKMQIFKEKPAENKQTQLI